MLKIIGAGLGRTGTTSLHLALERLGYKSIHFDQERLNDVLDGSTAQPDFRRYDDVDAVTDVPTAYFYRELFAAYPDARVILTVRDINRWWKSTDMVFNYTHPVSAETPLRYQIADKFRLEKWIGMESANDVFRRNLRTCIYGGPRAREYLYKRVYRRHNASVAAHIPSERLLIMDVESGDGWDKLCPFLGVAAPNTPFPHSNKTNYTELTQRRAQGQR